MVCCLSYKQIDFSRPKYVNLFFLTKFYLAKDVYGPLFSLYLWETYFAIVTCRNSQNEIENAIKSLLNQTIKPRYIIVVDDGSTDNTHNILEGLRLKNDNIHVITNPDLGYDIGRVVKNWNSAINLAKRYEFGNYRLSHDKCR